MKNNQKAYINRAKTVEILQHILNYMISTNKIEDQFAALIEAESEGEITTAEFHDWVGNFNIDDLLISVENWRSKNL
jgi:hypothetical protein